MTHLTEHNRQSWCLFFCLNSSELHQMSFYQTIAKAGQKIIPKHTLLKYAFNLSPMYRRSTGRIYEVSKDIQLIRIRIRKTWKNRNYVNTIFGGSMFSSVDPIPMVQLINLLDHEFVVWDKSAEIQFKRPANQTLYADFQFTEEELQNIRDRVAVENEIDIIKTTFLTNKDQSKVFCEVKKTLYIANKDFYKHKRTIAKAKKEINDATEK